MTSNFSSQLIEVICIADTLELKAIQSQFAKHFVVNRYRDALHIDLPKGHVFIFDYGVVVTWGISAAKKADLIEDLKGFYSTSASEHWEVYQFNLVEDAKFSISNDTFTLGAAKAHTLLAISHAFAQSRKLEVFESQAENTIAYNRHLATELATTGNIKLSRKKLAMRRGALFQTKNDIMLRFSLLDVPEYFWDYPATQEDYLAAIKYLELTQRIELLNLKLETIHELFEMLAAEQNHKHSSFLEWIIIILIAVEIVLFFVH
ncbi:RMD1 family protein [Aliiglaciecola sp. 3_MG-2023]|uniref:RMD1 family protein n=1 Tax=Aliiglaciecola sp. 3_MG-2023 TaxID=3062644 RepID=UPI0026E25B4E|nr:RMD1 family protein [Aliiglaciecola sp. 3_MG-2023]MDO6694566.1 RMD1 family protein [Aliiglaciecola sp. 3_MG-2023]